MELLAVIALLALLTGIAVPNIISTINNNKRDTFLLDAKRMVSKAEYLISGNKEDRDAVKKDNKSKIYTFADLNAKSEFASDADGGGYDTSTYVKVSWNATKQQYDYCICVIGSKRRIGTKTTCNSVAANDCINSEALTGIDKVIDK